MKLKGQVALVTGGGRGIGKSIALAYAKEGADVVVVARRTREVDAVTDEINQLGSRGISLTCDVSNREDCKGVVDKIEKEFGRLDILVNNAGGGLERTKVGEDNPDTWKEVIDINLLGTYYFSRQALPLLKQSTNGRIINIGSGMGHQPRSGNSSYNCAKAAVWMLTRCMSMELWEDKIAVNEIIPGPVYTELTQDVFQQGKTHPGMPSEWVKEPDDLIPIAIFLAEQQPNGPTGQSFSLARRPVC